MRFKLNDKLYVIPVNDVEIAAGREQLAKAVAGRITAAILS